MTEQTTPNELDTLKAQIAALTKSVTGLETKNSELIDREKKAKDAADAAKADADAAAQKATDAADDAARKAKDIDAIEASWRKKLEDEQAKTVAEKTRADNAIKANETSTRNEAIVKAVADSKMLDHHREMFGENLMHKAELVDGKVLITTNDGKQTLETYLADFENSERGKHYFPAPANTGAAVTTQTNATGAKTWSKFPETDEGLAEWNTWSAANPDQASALLDSWNTPF